MPQIYRVSASSLNMRAMPDRQATALVVLPHGQVVARLDEIEWQGEWWRVFADVPDAGAYEGYVFSRYIGQEMQEAAPPPPAPPPPPLPDMAYPGRVIKVGEADAAIVTAVQARLGATGLGPFTAGSFDEAMADAVEEFQSRMTAPGGAALQTDGEIGPMTWAALFPPTIDETNAALMAMLKARSQIGVHESGGANRGPEVDQYLRAAGLDPERGDSDGYPWCMAFVYWCFDSVCRGRSIMTRRFVPFTAGVHQHIHAARGQTWDPGWRGDAQPAGVFISRDQAAADPSLIKPGLVFLLSLGAANGHCGFVTGRVGEHQFSTIEGNTNPGGGRDGYGVFARVRGLNDKRGNGDHQLAGFVDYSSVFERAASGARVS